MHLTKRILYKLAKYIALFTLLCFIVLFNLGEYLDASDKPEKADVIVCLGGGSKARIANAIKLYENAYSTQNILILTGDNRSKIRVTKHLDDNRIEYLKKNNLKNVNIVQNKDVKNTKQEILFIKKYLVLHNYTSAIIVSNTPHTRRIKALISMLNVTGDTNLKFYVVGSKEKWWHSATYYKNKQARMFAAQEVVKLFYAYVVYGFLEHIGLSQKVEKYIDVVALKKEVNKMLITTFK